MQVKELLPIFIGKTKSFWLGILPAALTMLDLMVLWSQGDPDATPVANAIAIILGKLFGWSPEDILSFMVIIAPIYTFIVAQQRSGFTRPYALTPAGEQREAAVLVKDVSPQRTELVKQEVARSVSKV